MTKSGRYYPDPPMEKDNVRGKAKVLAEEDTDEEDDQAYDDSKRNVIGVFKTMVKVGPIETEVEFTVLHISMTFSLLLGRIWFHPLGGVPSTLHQKIKIPH
ncbi:hypothetical protein GH714_030338 [Hevea brasiliensis]|uniref:Uncharacterized protein n=1 Tax=Hevea brasiliensis TaxID=3981 RepID=A0A6A6M1U0_HEVBR|nr:hypothetical protein GH714_030338 [Hevea brasiliensis]